MALSSALLLVLAPILCHSFLIDSFVDHGGDSRRIIVGVREGELHRRFTVFQSYRVGPSHNSFSAKYSRLHLRVVCFKGQNTNWNDLKVTWGPNPFNKNYFDSLPRTEAAAKGNGWTAMTSGACNEHPNFAGKRYWKNNDLSAILIYGGQGNIAGIQFGLKQNYSPNPNHFPFTKQRGNSFVLDGDTYFLTAYFVDPSTVCTGRSGGSSLKTGTGLWIQNGSNPVTDSFKAPMTQTETVNTRWVKGACFATMGMHYWYGISKTMDCEDYFPVFLLYNKGVLNAFGWAMQINLSGSTRVEHPPQGSYGMFMNPVPDCLANYGTLTTMHIYMTSSIVADDC